MFGGFAPYPRRFGGGKPRLQIVHESLNAQRGTALDASNPDTIVWLENHAIARALTFDGWGTNERLALQWDPRRTTDLLPRWEKIFAIAVPPRATEYERRTELVRRWRRFGDVANHAKLTAVLADRLGDFFVAVEYISPSKAVIHVPDGSYPWGTVVAGIPWYSTVAHVLVLLQKPPGATEADFYAAAALVGPALDPFLAAWDTFDWYRAPAAGAPITVPGGPSQAGFYLDNASNLDNAVFDI